MRTLAIVRGERLDEWSGHALALALGLAADVVALAAGPGEGALRRALALGAATAVRIDGDGGVDPLGEARALVEAVRARRPAFVVAGADAPTGPGLAGLLGVPVVPAVRSAELVGSALCVRRELDGGRIETVEVEVPAVLAVVSSAVPLATPSFRRLREAERAEISVEHAPAAEIPYVVERRSGPVRGARPLPGEPRDAAAAILALVRERLV